MKLSTRIIVYCSTIFFVMGLPVSVFADGMVIKPDPYRDRWDYSTEKSQQAFINYENKTQKMIVAIDTEDLSKDGAVWLFPVPAEPQRVVIDTVDNVPSLNGEEINDSAKMLMRDIRDVTTGSQIYPLILTLITRSTRYNSAGIDDSSVMKLNSIGSGENRNDVTVYEHLVKDGITTEIITAKTSTGIYDYLKKKGLKIEVGEIPALGNYIGKNYSFVVSWIEPKKTTPLTDTEIEAKLLDYSRNGYKYTKLTSLMAELERTDINFANAINQRKFGNVSLYYAQYQYLQSNPTLKTQVINRIKNDPTILNMQTNSSVPLASANNKYASVMPPYYPYEGGQKGVYVSFPTDRIFFPLIPTSVYGSKTVPATIRIIGHVTPKVFSGLDSYTETGYYIDRYASLGSGFNNFYSGSTSKVKYTKIEINAPSKMLTEDLWVNNLTPARTFIPLAITKHPFIIGIILFLICTVVASILAGLIVFRNQARDRKGMIGFGLLGLFNFLSIVGFIIATLFWRTKELKEEDKPLFDELQKRGYSTSGFRIKDIRKLIFVPVFSAIFVALLWIITSITGYSL